MKQLIRRIIINPFLGRLCIRPLLFLHNVSYTLADRYALALNKGVHPKHRLMRYHQWFVDGITDSSVVVDIGCHQGSMTMKLAQKAKLVYGIDSNPANIAVARRIHCLPNIQYACADATAHDFGSCSPVDCVILSNVLEHIADRRGFLQTLIAHIPWKNPREKRLLLRVPMLDRDWIVLYKKQLGMEYRLDRGHYTEYTLESFTDEMHQAGLTVNTHHIRFGELYAVCTIER